MADTLEDCPCSGKNMSNLAAPWVLLTLYQQPSLHGYELTRIIRERVEAAGMHLNMTGLYRHLNMLEQRGMLVSQWDLGESGPARRTYNLTRDGQACLLRWLQTLTTQISLIERFFDEARQAFRGQPFPAADSLPAKP